MNERTTDFVVLSFRVIGKLLEGENMIAINQCRFVVGRPSIPTLEAVLLGSDPRVAETVRTNPRVRGFIEGIAIDTPIYGAWGGLTQYVSWSIGMVRLDAHVGLVPSEEK